jgi:hypothetical protein
LNPANPTKGQHATPRPPKPLAKQLDHRKQEKRQWLQNPSHMNDDNVENTRRKLSKHVTNKHQDYLNNKINQLHKNSKNKNIRELYKGIN